MVLRVIYSVIETLLRNISGGLGRRFRYLYYKSRFRNCGQNIQIDEGVFFENPGNISLGSNVWIDKQCIFITGKLKIPIENITKQINPESIEEGALVIGDNVHLGIGTIIQAHGGVQIGDYFTCSPGCKIYSVSNDVKKCKHGTYGEGEKHYIISPIKIEDNVWLGMNVLVLGGTIGKDSFVAANSQVVSDIHENSFAMGTPSEKIKNRFEG